MIIETIFSTVNPEGHPNFAPMGVIWGEAVMTVRPFTSTTTYHNLAATGVGVANVTDNVLAFVRSALFDAPLAHFPAQNVPGVALEDACCWFELRVARIENDASSRADVHCHVVGRGRQRDFVGFNRGKNAVIEATILATRLQLYTPAEIQSALSHYREIVAKTGGDEEREAMACLEHYVERWFLGSETSTC
ncbi:MAG TPA: DUF447 family protein [Chloroflexi bacterium]|mgnify:CR=1 FL=1|nr:DUF447 family protein [Chloroflexota bacterium]